MFAILMSFLLLLLLLLSLLLSSMDFIRNANANISVCIAACSEVVNRRQTLVFSATLTFVPTKPQRLEFAKKKKKKFHQITTKEKLGYFYYLFDFVLHYEKLAFLSMFFCILVSGFRLPNGLKSEFECRHLCGQWYTQV